ncbi:DnaJ-class molecular chaperone [Rhizobium tibeticum]|uniref:Chaperone protein DnaJ n=1 Tax=Rhizobium tibeticum TaxID=501024 RepID=A0A1H8CAC7_9HYPH|nr:DnaJ C-terminal domain-containing protein [Rhizobium tibeticum]MDP9808473.1 DnaJ-class molecular chaperone [Rhizobium tibeticum]SEH46133.1 Chaperone protein DnaJ [Rhizobium tibeticum]SEM92005.1 DnaJ C terminal domain-containing protein [Rhizobium tibeticum]
MRDPYKILGVKRDAGQDEIKAAWRNMAKAVHPDHNQGDPTASARFAEIGRAYETLKDPKKRVLFDNAARMAEAKVNEGTIMQQRQAAREAAVRAKAAQANAERVMEELARAAAQKAAADVAKQQKTGTAELPEEMVERIFGTQARAAAGGGRPQGFTAGAAKRPDAEPATSDKQPDAGKAEAEQQAAEDAAAQASAVMQPLSLLTSLVRRFTGSGAAAPEKAPDQVVTKTVTVDEVIKGSWVTVDLGEGRDIGFALAAGTTEGHQVRLKGQGHKLAGMQRGDAVVSIHIATDERFTVNGFDLHTALPVTIENAVLGTEARIEGPNGPITVTIPAWSGSDKTIRLQGQGLANAEGSRGDLVVELRIMLWEKPDDKVTDLMRIMKNGLFL